jgi:hypothetical protein
MCCDSSAPQTAALSRQIFLPACDAPFAPFLLLYVCPQSRHSRLITNKQTNKQANKQTNKQGGTHVENRRVTPAPLGFSHKRAKSGAESQKIVRKFDTPAKKPPPTKYMLW